MTSLNGTADAAALRAVARPEPITQFTMENGIVLRIKPVPPMMLRTAARHLERPKPPMWHNEAKGTDEENPFDPDYLRDSQQWAIDVSDAGFALALILGTEVVSVPDGIEPVDSDAWIEDLRAAHEVIGRDFVVHTEGKARYLDWLRLYAIPTNTDTFRLTKILTSGIALTDEEVEAAARSFRRDSTGSTDSGRPAADDGADVGDQAPVSDPGSAA